VRCRAFGTAAGMQKERIVTEAPLAAKTMPFAGTLE
jgi:hypothetical protein